MPHKKRRNTDVESTKKVLPADRELDERSEKIDEEDEILQKWWLHMEG